MKHFDTVRVVIVQQQQKQYCGRIITIQDSSIERTGIHHHHTTRTTSSITPEFENSSTGTTTLSFTGSYVIVNTLMLGVFLLGTITTRAIGGTTGCTTRRRRSRYRSQQ